MPLSIYKKLGLGDPTPTNMRLVMAVRSVKRPVGILNDVLVKVSSFIFPANFVILDCKEDSEVPIILGRPFLATGSVLIDMKDNELLFRINDEVVRFDICKTMKQPSDMNELSVAAVHHEDTKALSIEKQPTVEPLFVVPLKVEHEDNEGYEELMSAITEIEPYTPKQPDCDLKNQPKAKTPFDEPPMLESQELPDYLRNLEAKVDYVSQLSDVDKAKVDCTSQLLDDVLSSILSRMTIKDAVKTSILSTRVRFYFSSIPVLEHVKISLRGDASMPYIFGEFAANLPAQVKSLKVTAWNTQVTHFPTEMQIFRNPRILVLLFESTYNFDIVKVSPVLDACPVLQSLEILDNIDELVSPVTSVKNDSAGTKPDKINTIKPRSMSNRNKVLPYYHSSPSTSSYNAGNIRRQSTGKLNTPDSRQDVIPHYLKASTGSFHDFSKYGRKLFSEAKPWHPLSKRKNKLPADEQSPARTLVGEAKKGTLVKQKLFTPPGSVMGEKKKVTGVKKKPSTSPGIMLGEEKKRTVVMQKTFTTSRSN
ncbi:hypothetical protein CQW23_31720 [Capsicum baccatum]|uniref:Uncharacterized protein n=1 Tax=Capsicum baccatum TaxID=33114 RepID=A0A2G2V6P9_CAPBA|nr:hypothetical protein CQW23_31720 [Capsicum baccatum]